MKQGISVAAQSSGFNLKNEQVDLIHSGGRPEHTHMTIDALEAMRVERPVVPASKHGLEVICGASCETGAQ